MANKNKIPKDRPLSEMIGEKEKAITMEEVISKMDQKQQEEKETKKQERKSFNKKIKDMARRKDNQFAEDKRRGKLLEAIQKVQEENER